MPAKSKKPTKTVKKPDHAKPKQWCRVIEHEGYQVCCRLLENDDQEFREDEYGEEVPSDPYVIKTEVSVDGGVIGVSYFFASEENAQAGLADIDQTQGEALIANARKLAAQFFVPSDEAA